MKVLAVAILALGATETRAEPCTGTTEAGKHFATCFDLGNRLSLTGGSDGFGGSVALRHVVTFDDDPDLVWKLSHVMLDATHAGFSNRFTGVVYQGRFLRHARDGHIVVPGLGQVRKLFLPFDIGGYADVGKISWTPDSSLAHIGVVDIAPLVDFSRTRSFRRRIAFGPVARWDVTADRDNRELAEHVVSPFTSGMIDLAAESETGRLAANLHVEAGSLWSNKAGWHNAAEAEAAVERIVLAVNERPIAVVIGARYASDTDEFIAHVGARVVLFDRRDPRVR